MAKAQFVMPEQFLSKISKLGEATDKIVPKVLAAGAINPKEGFKYAFDNGADFICVGMYDFQIVEDVNIALDSLSKVNRIRPWRG